MDQQKNTYAIYARRSSSDETRQVQSIERQLGDLERVVDQEGLVLHKRKYIEEQSAFRPGREVFRDLVRATKRGSVNSWLCWHPNRLARNATDAGKIIQLLDDGHLKEIKTPTKTYYNTSNDKTFLMIDLTFSKRDSDDKSEIVRSGMRKRYERGYPSGTPPAGYKLVNDGYESSVWAVDEERFDLVRKVFRRFLRGDMSVRSLTLYAKSIGLTTSIKRTTGGEAFTSTSIYRNILRNPVYAGFFFDPDNKRYSLKEDLPRIITEKEFQKVRLLLLKRKAGKTPTAPIVFAYKDILKDTFGRSLQAERKHQLRCSCGFKFAYKYKEYCPRCSTCIQELESPKLFKYTYYTARSLNDAGVVERTTVSEVVIQEALLHYMKENLPLTKRKREIHRDHLEKMEEEETTQERRRGESVVERKSQILFEKTNLRALARKGIITSDELEKDLFALDEDLKKFEKMEGNQTSYRIEKKFFEDLPGIHQAILTGSDTEKAEALTKLPLSLVWDGERVLVGELDSISYS